MKERAENVQKQIDALHANIDLVIENYLSDCESPIEELFGLGLLKELGMLNADCSKQEPEESMYFETQQEFKIGKESKCRVDFVITMYDAIFGDKTPITDWETQLVVECDGWDYHSTKEQVNCDNERDRELLLVCGIPTIRFTGREINKDPYACAKQAIEALKGYNNAVRNQISLSIHSMALQSEQIGPELSWMTITQAVRRIQKITEHDEFTHNDLHHHMKCDNYTPKKQHGTEFVSAEYISALLYDMGKANF